ncbi:S53 family peptidase [Pengzhenrongella sp.]|jgi:subtilase family serine protease|uniref:S53 family peptidase n=1 Tax=Pengzhenrongella sp. TaxID=2888820 RepID=UPI002F9486B9
MRSRPIVMIAAAAASLVLLPGVAVSAPAASAHARSARVCATPAVGFASCHALIRTDVAPLAKPGPNVTPQGYGPTDIQSAYNLAGASAAGRTVAIVDAYDDPTAEADLKVYRAQFGLPECTTANRCFKKVNQTGGTKAPRVNGGWAQEISLDLDMVSAACPSCHILLVEASSASFANLGTAVNTAARAAGVVAISNSYGGGDAADTTYGSYYNHPGIAITASTGDSGYQGGSFPASSSYVTAVGGTSLTRSATTRGWSESVWSGAGSGCSAYNIKLDAAATSDTGCAKRAMADVSAVADPATGVAVYDSTAYQGFSGWMVFGGTSASAPIIGAVYALSGNTAGYANALPYQNSAALNDVTTGSNGSCPTIQWCTARAGWDGPTGLGTPNGAAAF